MDLKQFEFNITSQWGEDGVIEEIFKRIQTESKLCIEFGAWDGKHLSNCFNLWNNKAWNCLLIEGDRNRFNALVAMHGDNKRLYFKEKFVGIDKGNRLEDIIDDVGLKENPDLISIDIDGDDYYIFNSLQKVKPRVIIVEYNPTIPPEIEFIQPLGESIGSSASALVKLAKEKGYYLAHITKTNLVLVRSDLFNLLNISIVNLEESFDRSNLVYVINGYWGATLLSKSLPYNKGYLPQERISFREFIRSRFKKKKNQSSNYNNFIPCQIRSCD